ncbi:membrane metalloprotease [Leptobacterium sp. I13]|uniref:membrane metalloprotease n=1 Tax=Leptobacterium meishanense TaxID=3128904 RepID=UPI0030EE04DD
MKKLHVLAVLFLFLFIISCSSDNDPKDVTPPVDRSANLQPVGSSARDLLTQNDFTSLVLEIVYVSGFRPTDQAIANLVSFINDRTFKPGGVTVEYTEVSSPNDDEFSIQEIADLETDFRVNYNEGNEIAVYIFFADAPSENTNGPSVVLGSAYRNTSIVIYESTIFEASNNNAGITSTTIESAALMHEFAHILGLVDLGTPLTSDHLDTENGNHCNVDGCLMEAQIQFGSLDMMSNNTIPQLEALCIQDLQANGGK